MDGSFAQQAPQRAERPVHTHPQGARPQALGAIAVVLAMASWRARAGALMQVWATRGPVDL